MARQMNYQCVASQFDRRYTDNEYGDLERFLLRFISGTMSGSILEVGCGTGHWLEVVTKQGYRILGLDPSSSMLSLASQKLPQSILIQGRAEAIPCSDASLDRVFLINALHHTKDSEKSIAEAYRILRRGGGLISNWY